MNRFYSLIIVSLLLVTAGTSGATEVTFKVYTSYQQVLGGFDPAINKLVVAGDFNDWDGRQYQLSADEVGENGLFVGTFDLDGGDPDPVEYEYRFEVRGRFDPKYTESIDFRTVTVGGDEIVIDPVWFNDDEETEVVSAEILFKVDMSVAREDGDFDPEDDAVIVRGDHPLLGYDAGYMRLNRIGVSNVYAKWFLMPGVAPGVELEYLFGIDNDADYEEPVEMESRVEGARSLIVSGEEGDIDENGYLDVALPSVKFNDYLGSLRQDLRVVLRLNSHPAWSKFAEEGIEGINSINGFWVAGFGELFGWDWANLPAAAKMRDDGVGADQRRYDGIFTLALDFPAGTPLEQTYKYGINRMDLEADPDLVRYVMLDETEEPMIIEDLFGEIGDLYEDYLTVERLDTKTSPQALGVTQNFPNPFNPTTTIEFSIPNLSNVSFRVVSANGRVVTERQMGSLYPGNYSVEFNGHALPAGKYVYTVDANGQAISGTMTLIK